ncbi:hypothetical protein CVT24_004740 [Panaeolus cyanescens]|uniref:BTB domain-containing protein n=1 Tax=Panaeolus cyanescens TaxID=181874 RepID=A0A409V9S6_9AGAR|nr:hypothetical protein CVT24_004740 [Panaeolus cyanescens]
MSNWSTFTCENADFKVRSVPDNIVFNARRTALLDSEVFRDMFDMCDPGSPDADEPLDLHETSSELIALLRLLHDPPVAPKELPPITVYDSRRYDPATVIPLPLLLSLVFPLVDKYAIKEETINALKLHLHAHARTHALEVYAFATVNHNDMEWIASAASQYIQPLASYRFEEIKVIPNVIAYHKLVRLQDFRVKALRDLLLGEDIFPRGKHLNVAALLNPSSLDLPTCLLGYGACPTHRERTIASWDRQRKALMGRIETGNIRLTCIPFVRFPPFTFAKYHSMRKHSATDVAGEMGALTDTLSECKTCQKACIAAVEMLAYKCHRLPRRLDQLPNVY